MINYFRKIRRKLLSENKLSKYLIYAIGEIALVMIGILLALQVNTWSESVKNRTLEKEFRLGLKKDLERDKKNIAISISSIKGKIEAHNTLIEELPISYKSNKQTLDSLFQFLMRPLISFYPVSGTFDSAISSGNISNFTDKSLIEKAHSLYNSKYPRLIYNIELADARVLKIRDKYAREMRTGVIGDFDSERLNILLDDISKANLGNRHRKSIFEESLEMINDILDD